MVVVLYAEGDTDVVDVEGGDDMAGRGGVPPFCHSFTIEATLPGDLGHSLLTRGLLDEENAGCAGTVIAFLSTGGVGAAAGVVVVGDEVTFFSTGVAATAVVEAAGKP